MHGLFCIYNTKEKSVDFNLSCFENSQYICSNYSSARLSIHHVTLNKFINDKCLFENDSIIAVVEGVIVNNHELYEKYHVSCMSELVNAMYATSGHEFFNEFRGSFCGLLYDKASETMYVYNDHIGDKLIYYINTDKGTYIASDLKVMVQTLQNNNIEATLCHAAAYNMLSFGFMQDDTTYVNGVKRLLGGHYLKITGNESQIIRYHQFSNKANDLSEEDNIEKMDLLFRQGVKRITDKNSEYGYKNIMPLSAGLDSRMVVWIAREMTSEPIVNFTYSQSGFYDEAIPQEIAHVLGHEWHFTPLDGGEHLKDIDITIGQTDGTNCYDSCSIARKVTNRYKDQNIGIIATGISGDVMRIYLYVSGPNDKPLLYKDANNKSTAKKYDRQISKGHVTEYPNREIQNIYVGNFYHHNMGSPLAFQNITETISPFHDVDFLEFTCSIPYKHRSGYNINDKWILQKYPQAAQWKHNGDRQIGDKARYITIFGRNMKINDVVKRGMMYVAKRTGIYNYDKAEQGSVMEPTDTWIEEPSMSQFMKSYKDENIGCLKDVRLKEDTNNVYDNGLSSDKLQAITLIAAIKHLGI